MQKRITKYIMYVSREVMTEPDALFDAAFKYFIKKHAEAEAKGKSSPVGFLGRKKFMAAFNKAPTNELKLAVVDKWILARDAATFPFKKEEGKADEGEEAGGGVPVDDGADGESEPGDASE